MSCPAVRYLNRPYPSQALTDDGDDDDDDDDDNEDDLILDLILLAHRAVHFFHATLSIASRQLCSHAVPIA